MCGIGGILRREAIANGDENALRLQRALLHRGPDDRGLYRSSDGFATLVHTRLAILDLSAAGRQPMERNGQHITFNGELYNFRQLRDDLTRRGERFVTGTDTEVLLVLYGREGPSCLSQLRGMFAFAIWDERERSCFLARDRFGIKPLYYTVTPGNGLAFASETKALLAAGLAGRQLDSEGLDSFLATGSVAEPLTLFSGIRNLEAGHWMRWHAGKTDKRRYFQIDFRTSPETQDTPVSTQAALQNALDHHLVSDVPVGIFLSGGLDSGVLVALARRAGVRNLATFSIGLEDAPHDESESARRLSKFFGTRHHEMLLTRELARHWIDEFLDALDQPSIDGFNTYCICRFARDHGYKVVLSGLGGDEMFGGYPSFARTPRLLRLGKALRPLHRLIAPAARALESIAPTGRSARMAAYFREEATLPSAYQTLRSIFSPHEREKISRSLSGVFPTRRQISSANAETESDLPTNVDDAISHLELTRYMRNQLLRDADVMSMAHGLELRVPFLDHELFAVLRAIPPRQRLQRGKQLLREAVPCLPSWHAAGRKLGFSLPFGDWLGTTWKELGADLSRMPRVPLDSWARKWSLIVLQRWLRQNEFPAWPT